MTYLQTMQRFNHNYLLEAAKGNTILNSRVRISWHTEAGMYKKKTYNVNNFDRVLDNLKHNPPVNIANSTENNKYYQYYSPEMKVAFIKTSGVFTGMSFNTTIELYKQNNRNNISSICQVARRSAVLDANLFEEVYNFQSFGNTICQASLKLQTLGRQPKCKHILET